MEMRNKFKDKLRSKWQYKKKIAKFEMTNHKL